MTTSTEKPVALVLGITGGIGRALALALHRRGYRVRAMSRAPETAASRGWPIPIEWRAGDAARRRDVMRAADGADILVHAVNPPGYAKWRELAVPMLANSIAVARATGSMILFPGNIYVFGPDVCPLVDETAKQDPGTTKGAVRVDMEAMLREAAKDGVRSLIVRAGDFFGPDVPNSWFTQGVAKGGHDACLIQDLAAPGIGHGWAYLPDLAETFMRLLERRAELPIHAVFHFRGHWLADNRVMAETVKAAIGRPEVKVRRFFWPQIFLGAIFVPFLRELIEMRWFWQKSLELDNRKLEALIGPEPHTPLIEAVATSLAPSARLTSTSGLPAHA